MGSGRVRLISVKYKITSLGRQRKVYGGLAMKNNNNETKKISSNPGIYKAICHSGRYFEVT